MRVTRVEATIVRYENDTVFANVFHGRTSCEIGVEFGLLALPEDGFYTLGAARRLAGLPGAAAGTFANTAELVREVTARLAGEARQALTPPLTRGDPGTFKALRLRRKAAWRRYEQEVIAGHAREKAERARMAQDFNAMASAYAEIEGELTPLEKKRLAYARKRIAGEL